MVPVGASCGPFGSPLPVPTVQGIAFSTNGNRAYVTQGGASGMVWMIDPSSNAFLGTIVAGSSPHGICADPNGSFLYVANNGAGNVSVVYVGTSAVVSTVATGGAPWNVVSPSSGIVCMTDPSGGKMAAYNTGTGSVVWSYNAGRSPWDVAAGTGNTYWTRDGASDVWCLNAATGSFVWSCTVGSNPRGVAVAPASGSGLVYACDSGSGTVSVIPPSGGSVSPISVGGAPEWIAPK